MAEACLGCGTKTDSNGDLTISGARSSVWKTAYGTNIDANNGLRCDPATGKLWTAPPSKTESWVINPGAWISGLRSANSFAGYYYRVGTQTPYPLGNGSTVVGVVTDSDNIALKRYVAAAGTFSWVNPTNQRILIRVDGFSKLGFEALKAGSTAGARGSAGVEINVAVNNAGPETNDLESYFGNPYAEARNGSFHSCTNNTMAVLNPGQQLIVSIRPYFKSQFSNTGVVQFFWSLQPKALITATSLFQHSAGLDLV